jgi:hypothetical protein
MTDTVKFYAAHSTIGRCGLRAKVKCRFVIDMASFKEAP